MEQESVDGEYQKVQQKYRRVNNQVRGKSRNESRRREKTIAKYVN